MTTRKLQSLANSIDRRSNDYDAIVIGDRIRVTNLADANWHGRTEDYTTAFARIAGLAATIDWATGEIWLGPAK